MSYHAQRIAEFCLTHRIPCTAENCEAFDTLYAKLLSFNAHTNITRITEAAAVCDKHFLDSLYPLAFGLFPENACVLDLGCGGGFPGLPLSIMRRDLTVTFLDSTAKKLLFVKQMAEEFSLNANVVSARAEDWISGHREAFDVVVSRAVADLPILCELALPYVKVGGKFIAYKSQKGCDLKDKSSELSRSANALSHLGGIIDAVYDTPLFGENGETAEHAVAVIKKIEVTDTIYPRKYAAIKKLPL